MTHTENRHTVEKHYAVESLERVVLGALEKAGADLGALRPQDLAPVDEFHIRGRESTVELGGLALPAPGARVLDVGCGLGGTARYLASTYDCHVTGIDLTQVYCDVAALLSARMGHERTRFEKADACRLPFHDDSFDVVVTEHAQMNIDEKETFYAEIGRVVSRGGRFAFHDIFLGPEAEPLYPVPWAQSPEMSFLATPEQAKNAIRAAGLDLTSWRDCTAMSVGWFEAALRRMQEQGPPVVGLHLLMGATAKNKFENLVRNLREGRVVVAQGLAVKA